MEVYEILLHLILYKVILEGVSQYTLVDIKFMYKYHKKW